ncbi:hypothetical protein B9Z55_000960 [Caenorhabditis nigoni]|uniref:MAGE domain-containing protein n=1 Tax=Caenorhabditis nigoni TaxID=1611254 RepID=A0A2G5VVL9_9PELO|nr:hypothetical protein B9Z55_000960 [Caenorhabditis nigoni]
MSSESEDDAQTSREEDVLAYEIFFWIIHGMSDKGFVKISELRKLYQKAVTKNRSIQYRSLQEILKIVNKNLAQWQGWDAVLQDDRLTYVNLNEQKVFKANLASETERTLGVLKNALMYIFVATKPNATHPGVTHEELMSYMEASMSTHPDHKLTSEHMELLKKQIAPNPRADFIRKGYLVFSKAVNENEEEVFRYEWGPAALQTVDPVHLVQMFQKLTGVDATQLTEQLERAKELKAKQMGEVKVARCSSAYTRKAKLMNL